MAVSEVFNCDCMEYMRGLPDNAFSLALVDSPYRDESENQPKYEMRRAGMDSFGDKPTDEFFKELKRVSRKQIIWGANNFGYPFKGFVAWDKLVRGADRYSQVEIASLSENISTVSKYVQIQAADKDKIHPTQKPIALYAWLLRTYAEKSDIIFDPFLGSQPSRIAAYKLGYDFYGCEINKEYYLKGCERFKKECLGISKTKSGKTIIEQNIFE